MKKIFVILLAALLIFSLSACGGKTDSDGASTTAPANSTGATGQDATDAPSAATTEGGAESAAPAADALLPGELYQLDAENPVVRGLSLAGNRTGSEAFNNAAPAAQGVRCIFELNEWVEVTPDTDAEEGLAVWVFRHKEDPKAYRSAALSEEAEGFAAYCELPFDAEAEAGASRGSFYLNPDDCEEGFYDFVFSLNGNATAVLLARFYNEGALENKTDAELTQMTTGLR